MGERATVDFVCRLSANKPRRVPMSSPTSMQSNDQPPIRSATHFPWSQTPSHRCFLQFSTLHATLAANRSPGSLGHFSNSLLPSFRPLSSPQKRYPGQSPRMKGELARGRGKLEEGIHIGLINSTQNLHRLGTTPLQIPFERLWRPPGGLTLAFDHRMRLVHLEAELPVPRRTPTLLPRVLLHYPKSIPLVLTRNKRRSITLFLCRPSSRSKTPSLLSRPTSPFPLGSIVICLSILLPTF